MNILLLNNCHFRRGGADIVYLNTGELLKSKGHKVGFLSVYNNSNINGISDSEYFVNEVNFFQKSFFKKLKLIPRFFYSFESKKKLEFIIKDFKPDVVHIHLYKGGLTSSIFYVLKKFNIPVVISIHDYGLLCPHNLLLDGKGNVCERCIKGNSINCIVHRCNRNDLSLSIISFLEFNFNKYFFPFEKYFDVILALSKFGYNIHSNKFSNKSKLEFLYNFYPNLEKELPTYSHCNYFLFLGRLSKEKGLVTLVNAWKLAGVDFSLKIAGTGELMENLKSSLGDEKSIELCGFKQGEELKNLIRNSYFVVVPSEWYENNPLSIIEAFALGKPVIGSNIGGIPELVINHKTGFIFEMSNEHNLCDVLKRASNLDLYDYQYMCSSSRQFAEKNFNPEVHYRKLISIYNSFK